jgi:hypothetical protein
VNRTELQGQLKHAAYLLAVAVGVTVAGVALGALVLAPAAAQRANTPAASTITRLIDGSVTSVTQLTTQSTVAIASASRTLPEPVRRLALPVLLGALALTGFAATGVSYLRGRPTSRGPSITTARARTASKTPKAVQALADSGAEPSEIAWRTGLSLDAVAMLLSLHPSPRQLRPPTA